MGLLDISKQYSNPGKTPTGDVVGHFDSVAQQASSEELGSGIAAALRSDATPPFGQAIGNLFGESNPNQKAGVLNEILQTLGPSGLADRRRRNPGANLGHGRRGPRNGHYSGPSRTGFALDLSTIAASAEKQDGSIVDRLGRFYAQHPTLVKSLRGSWRWGPSGRKASAINSGRNEKTPAGFHRRGFHSSN